MYPKIHSRSSHLNLDATTSNVSLDTFSWSAADNTSVTGETTTTSTSSFITDNLTNLTGVAQTVIYTVTPTSAAPGSCVGNPYTITVTVNPEPVGADPTPLTCSDVPLNVNLDATTSKKE